MLDLFYFRAMRSIANEMPASRSIKNWSTQERPREKFVSLGRDALTDAELLAVLLGTGYQNVTAVDLAREILNKYQNDLNLLAKASPQELTQIKGIGSAKALYLSAALELGRRRKRDELPNQRYTNAKAIFVAFQHLFADLAHEEFRILLLGPSNRLIAEKRISIGSATNTVAEPKKILRELILHQASGLVLMHNHPSGNLSPSEADRHITQKMAQASRMMDFRLMDHIIFGHNNYYSFNEHDEPSLTSS